MSYIEDPYEYEYEFESTHRGFRDVDDLLRQWRDYINTELQSFDVIPTTAFGTGNTDDLREIFEKNATSPTRARQIIPVLDDYYNETVYTEYTRMLDNFLRGFVSERGTMMSNGDLGDNEKYFWNSFFQIAQRRAIWNIWNLWGR